MFHWRIFGHRQKLAVICGVTCLVITELSMGAGSPFDGTYVGKRSLVTGPSSPECPVEEDASLTISGQELTFTDSVLKKFGIGFDPKPDGSFNQTYNGQGDNTVSIKGKITGDTIDADVKNYSTECMHHWHLTKERH